MKIVENGLVLREVKLREADKILTLMTPNHGIISASARGSMRPKSKLFSASGLFCYSEWTLYEGKTMYTADDASPIEVFFGLRESVEAMSLAAYIADLLQVLSPGGQDAQNFLKLTLNSYYLLANNKKPPLLVKAVFELRCLAESGFMPDLQACESCGKEREDGWYFDMQDGRLLCGCCAAGRGHSVNLDPVALAALRHIAFSEEDKVFNFTLKGNSLLLLCRLAEKYMLHNIEYSPKTLGFLKTILDMPPAQDGPETAKTK